MLNAWRSHQRLGPSLSPLRRSFGSRKLADYSRRLYQSVKVPDPPLVLTVSLLRPRQILGARRKGAGVRHVEEHRKVQKRRVHVKALCTHFQVAMHSNMKISVIKCDYHDYRDYCD